MSSIIGVSGQIGAIVAAILAAVLVPLFGWRELFLFGLIPVILAFIVRENLEESETWKNNQESGRQESGLSELLEQNN